MKVREKLELLKCEKTKHSTFGLVIKQFIH